MLVAEGQRSCYPGCGKQTGTRDAVRGVRAGRLPVEMQKLVEMFDRLSIPLAWRRKDLHLSRFTAPFVKLDLLVLDELGFIPIDQEGAQFLFRLIRL